MDYCALLDNAASGHATCYQQYAYSCFLNARSIDTLDDNLQRGWQRGLHVLICSDYEFGMPLIGLPAEKNARLSLHWFERQYPTDAQTWLRNQYTDNQPAGISTPQNDTDYAAYLQAVHNIQTAIARGDTYQINYTTRLNLNAYGHPARLYSRLRQPVPYGVYACLPNVRRQTQWILCFSPELFLDITPSGLIRTKPMKGTAPILNDGNDSARARQLQTDPKNRAENVMIVDLLRNDLSKIACTGKVRVPEPFKVSRFGSVWQMTSLIEAQAKPRTKAADIFRAAFPCGSITGAPKRMSMQIIKQTETAPRNLYTGSIGFLKPCRSGLGFYGTFNVVIRTLELSQQAHNLYRGVYGVGSGIVADSNPHDEYTECGWKARFLNNLAPEFGIFETMRVENKQCALLPLHIKRLQQSAAALNLPVNPHLSSAVQDCFNKLPDNNIYRVKAMLTPDDGLVFSHTPLIGKPCSNKVRIAQTVLPVHDYLRRFKTTHRSIYDTGWQQAEQRSAFDALFFNTEGHLLEGGRSNVFIKINNQWHTPATSLDILDGTMRQTVMANPQHYFNTRCIHQSYLTRRMLHQASEVRLSNALYGLFSVSLITE